MSVELTVEAAGRTTGVLVTEDSIGSDGLADCVVGTLSRLSFNPGPEGGHVTFAYELAFTPR